MLSLVFFPNKCVNRGIRQSCVYSSNEGSLEILGAHSIYRSKEIESIYSLNPIPAEFEPVVFLHSSEGIALRLLKFFLNTHSPPFRSKTGLLY